VALLAPLAGAGCAARPLPGAAAGSAAGPAALVERLPAVAAGFRRGEVRPAAGTGAMSDAREVGYATSGGRATAAAMVELLSEDTGAAAALDAMLVEAQRGGPGREMREAGRFTLAPGGAGGSAPPLFCAETAGRYGRERVAGLVCAGRAGGALLRIRVTMPAGREPAPADPRAFAEAIAAALSGSASAAAAAPSSG
jgi:hypothetical protein